MVVLGFFLCWAPFHFQRFIGTMTIEAQSTILNEKFREIIYYISGKFNKQIEFNSFKLYKFYKFKRCIDLYKLNNKSNIIQYDIEKI